MNVFKHQKFREKKLIQLTDHKLILFVFRETSMNRENFVTQM